MVKSKATLSLSIGSHLRLKETGFHRTELYADGNSEASKNPRPKARPSQLCHRGENRNQPSRDQKGANPLRRMQIPKKKQRERNQNKAISVRNGMARACKKQLSSFFLSASRNRLFLFSGARECRWSRVVLSKQTDVSRWRELN